MECNICPRNDGSCRYAQILDLVEKAGQYKQLKKGANEGMQTKVSFTIVGLIGPISSDEDSEPWYC